MRLTPVTRMIPLLLVALLGLSACKERDMDVYRAPKIAADDRAMIAAVPEAAVAPTPAALPIGVRAAPNGPETGPALAWNVPQAWVSKPVGGMRFATFGVPTRTGEAELSVVVLAGDAGGALANVNRWRGQLGLNPIDDAALQKAAKTVKSVAGMLLVVELVGADNKSGLIAAILPQATQTWFFKLTGSSNATSAAKAPLLQFLATLR